MATLTSVKIIVRGGITMKNYTDYFFDEPAFDLHDGGYVPLEPTVSHSLLRFLATLSFTTWRA